MLILSGQYIWLIFFRPGSSMRNLATGHRPCLYRVFRCEPVQDRSFLYRGKYITNDYFHADTFEKAVFIAYQVLFIFLAYSLALMYNRSLLFEIATQEEKFSKAFNSSPYAFLITRYTDGTILEVNRGFTGHDRIQL
jgi:hypothetical protein